MLNKAIFLLIVSFTEVLLIIGCQRARPKMPPPAVEVTPIIQKDIPSYAEWTGITDGYSNVLIRPQVQGYLIKQNYKDGDYVNKGDTLFEIDPRPYEMALMQAQAQLTQSQSQYYTDSANLRRVRMLAPQDALSKRDLDNATSANKSAQSSVKAAQAQVDMAKLNLGFTTIIAPVSGIAGIAQVEVGDLVGPAQTTALTTLSEVNPIKVFFSISDKEYLRFFTSDTSKGYNPSRMNFELFLSDNSLYSYVGKFYTIDRQVDPNTGTIKVEALFSNPSNKLRPGQFARVRVTISTKSALLVPQRAVSQLQGKYMVAIVNQEQKIEIRMVTVGEQVGTLWVISKGLNRGELVVAEGVMKVKPGITVVAKEFNTESSPDTGKSLSDLTEQEE